MWIVEGRGRLVDELFFIMFIKICVSIELRNASESVVTVKNMDLNSTSYHHSRDKLGVSFYYNLSDNKQNFGQFIQSLKFQFRCNDSKRMDDELENEHGRDADIPDFCTNIIYLLQNMDFNDSLIFTVQSEDLISKRRIVHFNLTINASDIYEDGSYDESTSMNQVKNNASEIYIYPAPILTDLSRELLSSDSLVFTLLILQDQLSTNSTDIHHLQSSLRELETDILIKCSNVRQRDWTEVSNENSIQKSRMAYQLNTSYIRDFIFGSYKTDLTMDVISPYILGSGYNCKLRFRTNYWNKVGFVVKIKVDDLSYTAEVHSFSTLKSSAWKDHELYLGNINSTFQIYMHFYVAPGIIALNQLRFENCSDEIHTVRRPCSADEYQCRTGVCIQKDNVCNLVPDCIFGEDEADELCGSIPLNAKCNFENGSCSMMTDFTNCTAQIVEASSVGLISDHTKMSDKGMIMSLSREHCDKGIIETVTYDPPSIEMQRNNSCKLVLSQYLDDIYGYTRLFISVCQKYGGCQTTRKGNDRKKVWRTFKIPIFNVTSRFNIRIQVAFTTQQLIHLDDIFLTKECFAEEEYSYITTELNGDQDAEIINEKLDAVIIAGCVFGVIIPISIIVLLVCHKGKCFRKFEINRNLMFRRPVVKDTFISPTKRAYLKIGLAQVPESSPLMKRLEDVMAETNLTYNAQTDLPVTNDIKNIPRHRLKIMSELGRGAFGEVYLGVMIQPGNNNTVNVAVKKLRTLTSDEAKTDLLLEALTLSQFSHPNIVSCLGISLENGTLMLVLELLEGGDLKKFLRSVRPSQSSSPELHVVDLINLATDIAKGCLYLQTNRFIHRDIAARNCLLTQAGPGRVAKIADFGLAREMLLSDYYRKRGHAKLPVRWMPPEAFFDGIFTHKSDVWAYGVLLWEIFSYAILPYPGMSNSEVMVFVHQGNRLSEPAGCPSRIFEVMGNCWNLLPEFRPTFDEIVKELTNLNKEFYRNTDDEEESKIYIDDRQSNSYEYEEPQQINP